MKSGNLLAAGALAFALGTGLGHAKIPAPPMDDAAKAKAEDVKTKAAEAAKKDAEQLARAQDQVVERYKKEKAKGAEPAPAPASAAKGVKPDKK
jgi:hypothetical protein